MIFPILLSDNSQKVSVRQTERGYQGNANSAKHHGKSYTLLNTYVTLQPPPKTSHSHFSSAYSTCFYQAIDTVCSMEAADWLGRLVMHVPDFTGHCTPEPTEPGK